MSDLINLTNGWELFSLVKTPLGWHATIQKESLMDVYPHFKTRYKNGDGKTQLEALENAAGKKNPYYYYPTGDNPKHAAN